MMLWRIYIAVSAFIVILASVLAFYKITNTPEKVDEITNALNSYANSSRASRNCSIMTTKSGKEYRGEFWQNSYGTVFSGKLINGDSVQIPMADVEIVKKGC